MNNSNHNSIESITFTNYFIAYFDILGYKSIVMKKSDYEVKEFIFNIKECIRSSKDILLAFDEMRNMKVDFKVFSDNFIFFTERDYEPLLQYISILQAILSFFGIFIRGTLCHGKLYFDDDFIAGGGLVKAHDLESKEVINPRIIVDGSFISGIAKMKTKDIENAGNQKLMVTYNSVLNALEDQDYVYRDDDENLYLNYLHEIEKYKEFEKAHEGKIKVEFIKILQAHRGFIIKYIHENIADECVLKKYEWCRKYHNKFCEDNGYDDFCIIE